MDKDSDVAADEAAAMTGAEIDTFVSELQPHHPDRSDVQKHLDAKAALPNIFQRMNAVMKLVSGKVEKDGSVEIKGKKAYEYVSHDAVTNHLRGALVHAGITIGIDVIEHVQNGNRTEMTVLINFINMDNPDDIVSCRAIGYGVDPQDKGPGKALSYAVKSAYLKMFMLNSADDIEADQIEHESDSAKGALDAAQKQINQIVVGAAKTLNTALKGAVSVEAIEDLMKDSKQLLAGLPPITKDHFTALSKTLIHQLESE